MLVLSVSSLKGGVGKTSIALGLASAAAAAQVPTLVVDMDPQADASTGLDVVPGDRPDIADLLDSPKRKTVQAALSPSGWVGGQPGHLDVILGSPRAVEFDRPQLSDKHLGRLAEILDKVSGYDLVIVDSAPSFNGLTRAAWAASDRVAIVTEPGLFSVAAADRALRAVDDLRRTTAPNLQPLGVIVNRVHSRYSEHQYRVAELRQMFGPLVLTPVLPERSVLQQAQGSARPIHAWAGDAAAELARDFDQLLTRVLRSGRLRRRRR